MKVWVLTSGCYSDYSVVGVFSSKENAEKFAEKYSVQSFSDYNEPFETELDKEIEDIKQGLIWFDVCMNKDGTVEHCEVRESEKSEEHLYTARDDQGNKIHRLRVVAKAHNEQHAIKIANEKRAALIASNQWPDTW